MPFSIKAERVYIQNLMSKKSRLFSIFIYYSFIPLFIVEIRINRPKNNISVKNLHCFDIFIIPKITAKANRQFFIFKSEFVILLTPYAHIAMASVPITIRARPMIAFRLSFSLNTK